MVYAINSQPGHFTGIFKVKAPTQKFNHLDFIAESAFGGANAVVTCIMQSYSNLGPTHYLTIEKRTALSQVPGLRYGLQPLANLPRPASWDNRPLSTAAK